MKSRFHDDWHTINGPLSPEDQVRSFAVLEVRGSFLSMEYIAQCIATKAHSQQRDKAGHPYITHPTRVADYVRRDNGSSVAIALAFLHDVVEDTDLTVDEVMYAFADFSDQNYVALRNGLVAITHLPNEPNVVYYERILESDEAYHVKEWDIHDNTDPTRQGSLDEHTRERHKIKYPKARSILSYKDRWAKTEEDT